MKQPVQGYTGRQWWRDFKVKERERASQTPKEKGLSKCVACQPPLAFGTDCNFSKKDGMYTFLRPGRNGWQEDSNGNSKEKRYLRRGGVFI